MGRKLMNGATETVIFSQTNLRGITLNGFLKTNPSEAIEDSPGFDLSKVTIDITLKGRKKDITIAKGKLLPFLLMQSFFEKRFDSLHPLGGSKGVVRVTKDLTGDSFEEGLQAVYFDFGNVINLDGDDSLEVVVSLETTTIDTGVDSEQSSYMMIEGVEGVGLEYVTPIYDLISINSQQNLIDLDLGNNVTDISFINLDINGIEKKDWIITSLDLTSDRLSVKDLMQEIFCKRELSFEEGQSPSSRKQCWSIHHNEELDKCHLRIDLVDTKVSIGKNYLVVKRYESNKELYSKAVSKSNKHSRKASVKLGFK